MTALFMATSQIYFLPFRWLLEYLHAYLYIMSYSEEEKQLQLTSNLKPLNIMFEEKKTHKAKKAYFFLQFYN